jgi:WD40 repeat protein
VHHAAVLRCAYSPDGTRLMTASVDKTARVLRLPLARHGGDGTDLIGHTVWRRAGFRAQGHSLG